MRYYLAIDIGASSGRHIVGWQKDGTIRTEEVYRFPNGVQEENGHLTSFGYIYGSNLELGNQQAFDAAGQAITLIVVFVVTWIVSLVASFLEVGKKN